VTVIDHEAQPNPGPHDCSPTCIVLNSKTLELKYRFDYYMYGHFMKYIKRGAIRIESTPSKAVPNVAFKNPDGSIALITVNPAKKKQKFTIGWAGHGLKTELGPESIATLIWQP
jgi:glucosylceramidase